MKKQFNLPEEIEVKITKTENGNYIAELVEYDVFTQANHFEDLRFLVNDLIYTYFDVPKKIQKDIWYQPKKESPLTQVEKLSIPYQILLSIEGYKKKYYV